jgi:hypothetical protein
MTMVLAPQKKGSKPKVKTVAPVAEQSSDGAEVVVEGEE